MLTIAAWDPVPDVAGFLASTSWRLGFGDPTLIGWIIAVGYLLTALGCAWAFRVARVGARLAGQWEGTERRGRDRTMAYRASFLFWLLLCAAFLFLGVNKQVDIQILLTDLGREIARSQGWYEQRAGVLGGLLALILGAGLVTLAVLLRMTRDLLPRHVPAFAGMVLLACFVAGRALSFHQLNDILDWDPLGVRLRWMMELSGIAIVGTCAAVNCWWYRPGAVGRGECRLSQATG